MIEPNVRRRTNYARIFTERNTLLIFILNRFQITQNPSSAIYSTSCLSTTKILFTSLMFFPIQILFTKVSF